MDENLVALAQRGDRAAMADLLRSVAPRSRGVARSLLWNDAVAEDAAQQALVAMWRNLPKLRDPSSFDAWSYRIVANACHREARRVGGVTSIDGDEGLPVPVVDDDTRRIADRDVIERALRRLPLPQREVVALHHLGGLPEAQVAAALHVPIGTVFSRLHRGMSGLRAALEADARVEALAQSVPAPDAGEADPDAARRLPLPGGQVVAEVLARFPGRRITVSPDGSADAATIAAAVAMARTGDAVLVRPGTYREGVTLDRDVAVVGDGERDEVVVEFSRRNPLTVISGIGPEGTTTIATPYAFLLAGARPAVANLTIRGRSQGMAIVVHGGAPAIRGLRIAIDVPWGGQGTGFHFIFMDRGARGEICDNVSELSVHVLDSSPLITRNELRGAFAVVGADSEPLIRDNVIVPRRDLGRCLTISYGASVVIEHNILSWTAGTALDIVMPSTRALIRHNVFRGSRSGIDVAFEADVVIEENELSGNTIGMRIWKADPLIVGNAFLGNQASAILVAPSECPGPRLDGNRLSGNGLGLRLTGPGRVPERVTPARNRGA